ncbi:Carboxylesterase patB [Lasiodiplodia hormozganensis]|uniref:Carboxylesterase patB n=1 Tax=Lasiodiplodia hormozganensis TaxID=869390 RepID=A0AA39YIW1_9PEZI|nr:Carboxylesterase patB [Lasiodiplodia hormozganensis]
MLPHPSEIFASDHQFRQLRTEPSYNKKTDHLASVLKEDFETEDCLFLDVFVPHAVFQSRQEITQTEKPGAPVVVWIHGGEGLSGSKTLPAQPFELLKHGLLLPRGFRPDATVLVSVNYRLGVFGAFGDLGKPSDSSSLEQKDGNVGVQDQRMAIRWVREKIKLFGGDAGRVTIIRGAAAADGSTAGVLGLYHTAAAAADERVLRQHTVLPDGLTVKSFLRLANVSSLSEARSLPSEELIAANKALMDMLV